MIKLIVALGYCRGAERTILRSVGRSGGRRTSSSRRKRRCRTRTKPQRRSSPSTVSQDAELRHTCLAHHISVPGRSFPSLTVPEPSMVCVFAADAGSTMIPVPRRMPVPVHVLLRLHHGERRSITAPMFEPAVQRRVHAGHAHLLRSANEPSLPKPHMQRRGSSHRAVPPLMPPDRGLLVHRRYRLHRSHDGNHSQHDEGSSRRPHERPWLNFGHNKTEAMRLARDVAEYALLMDSDDMLVYRSTFRGMPKLDADSYPLLIQYGTDLEYDRPHIIRTVDRLRVRGASSRVPRRHETQAGPRIPGITYRVVGGGARSADPVAKFVRDAELLKKDLEQRPDHARSVFYLAQSYRDAGVEEFGAADKLEGDAADAARARARAYYDLSLETYEKRAAMGDAVEEAFVAKLEAAMKREHIQALDGEEPRRARPDVVWGYMAAWEMRPQRAEPLYELARYLRTYGDHFQLAYQIASIAAKIPRPNDWLFVNNSVYRWRALDELAISAYYVGQRTVSSKSVSADLGDAVTS